MLQDLTPQPLSPGASTLPADKVARVIDHGVALLGLILVGAWLAAVLYFPFYKQRPSGYLPVAAGVGFGLLCCRQRFRELASRWLTRCSPAVFLVGVGLTALGLRLVMVWIFPAAPVNDHLFFHRYAANIAAGQGYGGLAWHGLPHLHREIYAFYPPGISLLLGVLYGLLGVAPLGGKVMNCLIGVSVVLLLYDIGRRAIGDRVGRWAAVLAAVMPTLVFWSATLGYETVLGAIICAVIDLALLILAQPRRPWLVVGGIGVLLGFGCLVKPICLPIPLLLLGWWLFMGVGRRAWVYTAVVGLLMAVVIAPWTWRNYQIFGQFVLVSTNGGYVLYNANNPLSQGVHEVFDPLPGEDSEVAMDQVRRRAALQWMRANPGRVAELSVIKTTLTWGTATTITAFISDDSFRPDVRLPVWQENLGMAMLNTFWTALLVVVMHTTWTTRVWRRRTLYLAFALLGYLFAIHLLAEAETRHHIPVLGPLLLVAAYGLAQWESRGQLLEDESAVRSP